MASIVQFFNEGLKQFNSYNSKMIFTLYKMMTKMLLSLHISFFLFLYFNFLQEACIDYICDNISSLCTSVWNENGDQKLQFKEEEAFFHTELSEQLLVKLCEKKKLDDLTLTLFQV